MPASKSIYHEPMVEIFLLQPIVMTIDYTCMDSPVSGKSEILNNNKNKNVQEKYTLFTSSHYRLTFSLRLM